MIYLRKNKIKINSLIPGIINLYKTNIRIYINIIYINRLIDKKIIKIFIKDTVKKIIIYKIEKYNNNIINIIFKEIKYSLPFKKEIIFKNKTFLINKIELKLIFFIKSYLNFNTIYNIKNKISRVLDINLPYLIYLEYKNKILNTILFNN